jgi:hypothetical protein
MASTAGVLNLGASELELDFGVLSLSVIDGVGFRGAVATTDGVGVLTVVPDFYVNYDILVQTLIASNAVS